MSEVGLNENITVQGRTFHLQTSSDHLRGMIKVEIFEKGRLLNTIYKHYERRNRNEGPNERIKRLVEYYHQNTVNNISNIFTISSRIFEQNDILGHYRVGVLFYALNLFDEAEKHLNEMLKLNKDYYIAYRYLIKLSLKQNNIKKAVLYKNELLAYNVVDFADLYNIVGITTLKEGLPVNSIQFFKKAVDLNPNYFEALVNMFTAFVDSYLLLRNKLSEEEFEKKYRFLKDLLIKLKKSHQFNVRKNRYTFVNLDEIEEFLEVQDYDLLKKALYRIQEKFFEEEFNYRILGYEIYLRIKYALDGISEEELGFYQERIESILKEHPDYNDLWNVLGLIYVVQTKKLFNESTDLLAKALEMNEKYDKARKNLRLVENDGRELISVLNSMLR